MDSAVTVLTGAAFLKLYLHPVKDGGIDDRLVGVLPLCQYYEPPQKARYFGISAL